MLKEVLEELDFTPKNIEDREVGRDINIEEDPNKLLVEGKDSQYYFELDIANDETLYKIHQNAKNTEDFKTQILKVQDKFVDKKNIDFSKINFEDAYENL